ncbi:hypothetical protein [Glutamicibacter sp. NPDC090743]|uniref:hypothetical protein n=1 Tax=Glutamicibacter sp. NPDC090743 TaxID=3364001 RepID=UPI00382D1AE6
MNELHPLGRLIQAAQDREGWSTRDMERVAERNGYSMKHSNFSRLKIEPVVAIKASQIQVLASVLGVSEQAVAYAAVASMGVQMDAQDASLENSLRYSTDLSVRDQRLVLSLVSAMRDAESGTDGQRSQSQASETPALRAVAPEGDPRPGQKMKLPDSPEVAIAKLRLKQAIEADESAGYGITERHGDEARSIPVPPRDKLAAHPKVKTKREQLDEETGQSNEDYEDLYDDNERS